MPPLDSVFILARLFDYFYLFFGYTPLILHFKPVIDIRSPKIPRKSIT